MTKFGQNRILLNSKKHHVLYNKDVANDSNCINSFEKLGINIHGSIGEMKDFDQILHIFPIR